MATFTTKKLDDAVVPNLPVGTYAVIHKIDPSKLASYPAATDIIEFFDLTNKVRIVGGFLRVSGDIAAATSTVKLQAKQNATTYDLTATLAATAAGSTPVVSIPPEYDGETTIQVLVGTAALDAAGDIEVVLLTQNR
jgi:hypothetical protein